MKLSKERIAHMAESLTQRLTQQKVAVPAGSHQAMVETLGHAITEELAVEDKLNADVRTLMKKYEAEIDRGQVDYQKMFLMVKKQLAKDRGIIL
ncbi:MAG: DUF507 family protein [Nitrospiraceae bacterium]|nr:DUF507 family protein [Nitrospiraceae bacterium]MSR23561.1 DUF507 family protein [Nitrospiraceae bacterium]